ncbi:RagB/SusD family nutrient uptake outer membrane protein [Dysgonomonas sp. Marseille-P4677]|uniref:RagB/SusD family nutrient uptake outer membrane protein n=1 Tax=Dysgonomonas sp. Marseille-P4677 TaxID=2364790 RepID=UPI0019114969|nr:RagB/SusD family nutrient uptake outer membrane protein [Dysgonomonas sp. Marseille-P4677]MBK5719672.1 RagB/SusD family nutrient uptake outer membrane protein [Dysgonomonas sp. Marseille-P4677]
MKKYKFLPIIIALAGSISFSSCGDDFLTATPTEKQETGTAVTEFALLANLGSAYQILLFDSYADNNYNAVLLMSDLRSDDIYKGGGDAGDQGQLYKLSQFTSTAAETVGGLWNIYFTGLSRCNNVINLAENAVGIEDTKLEQYKGEAHFLRAYYTHLLWKFWGNIPYFEQALIDPPHMAKQLTADQVYEKIMADIDFACAEDRLPMNMVGANVGRVSKAAALMLKARVVLYQKDESRYAEITKDMADIIKSEKFDLFEDFGAMWDDENEFCIESIFESNQLPEGKTWSTGWQGFGTNLPAFISPNELKDPNGIFKGGWGFAPVRKSAYNIYESQEDTRRDGSINDWTGAAYTKRFQDTGLFQRKYAARVGYNDLPGDQDLNFANNLRIFRFAETLLNYAELVKMHGQAEQGVSAQSCLDRIRKRAFGKDKSIPATVENIKLERRREFLGEGMRFWDLVRWGDAPTVLTENDAAHNSVRTFQDWMKYLPIPQSDMESTKGTEFELKQNGQWK